MSSLPSVVTLNCIDDFAMEQDCCVRRRRRRALLSLLADGRIDSASAVLLQSLAYLPRAAKRRLRTSLPAHPLPRLHRLRHRLHFHCRPRLSMSEAFRRPNFRRLRLRRYGYMVDNVT